MNLAKQIFEIAGDRDFVHGVDDLAALDQETRRTARVVARDGVDALAEQFADDEGFLAVLDEIGQRAGRRLDEQIVNAAGIAGRRKPSRRAE